MFFLVPGSHLPDVALPVRLVYLFSAVAPLHEFTLAFLMSTCLCSLRLGISEYSGVSARVGSALTFLFRLQFWGNHPHAEQKVNVNQQSAILSWVNSKQNKPPTSTRKQVFVIRCHNYGCFDNAG